MNFNWLKGSMIGEDGTVITFFFNPSTIKISKNTKWNELKAAGREQGVLQYGCGDPRSFEFELKLTRTPGDNYPKSVVEKLFKMTKPTIRGAGVDRPPKVRLNLGNAVKTECIIDSIQATYGPLFNPRDLTPWLGGVSVKLTEIME